MSLLARKQTKRESASRIKRKVTTKQKTENQRLALNYLYDLRSRNNGNTVHHDVNTIVGKYGDLPGVNKDSLQYWWKKYKKGHIDVNGYDKVPQEASVPTPSLIVECSGDDIDNVDIAADIVHAVSPSNSAEVKQHIDHKLIKNLYTIAAQEYQGMQKRQRTKRKKLRTSH